MQRKTLFERKVTPQFSYQRWVAQSDLIAFALRSEALVSLTVYLVTEYQTFVSFPDVDKHFSSLKTKFITNTFLQYEEVSKSSLFLNMLSPCFRNLQLENSKFFFQDPGFIQQNGRAQKRFHFEKPATALLSEIRLHCVLFTDYRTC